MADATILCRMSEFTRFSAAKATATASATAHPSDEQVKDTAVVTDSKPKRKRDGPVIQV